MTRLAALALGALLPLNALAAELVMVEQDHCVWCARWDDEVGQAYPKTEEGQRAPLRRIDIAELPDAGLELERRASFTPTFILIEGGAEVGRIEGYPGEHFFWPMLGQLLERLDTAPGRS